MMMKNEKKWNEMTGIEWMENWELNRCQLHARWMLIVIVVVVVESKTCIWKFIRIRWRNKKCNHHYYHQWERNKKKIIITTRRAYRMTPTDHTSMMMTKWNKEYKMNEWNDQLFQLCNEKKTKILYDNYIIVTTHTQTHIHVLN